MTQPHTPTSWDELSMEQLREVHRLMGEYAGQTAVRNLNIWLYLTGLEFAEGEGEIAEDGEVSKTLVVGLSYRIVLCDCKHGTCASPLSRSDNLGEIGLQDFRTRCRRSTL